MSRAPDDDVQAYDGSGDWFKIFEEGVCNSDGDFTTDAWCTWERNYIAATIPTDTPSGEYLVRVEHIGKKPFPETLKFLNSLISPVQAFTNPSQTNPSTLLPVCMSMSQEVVTALQVRW